MGFGVLDRIDKNTLEYISSGIIQTPKTLPPGQRLGIIRADIITLIEQYSPDVMAIESIFFFKNAKTLVPVAQARGVILEAASYRDVDVAEYTPMQVKQTLTGYGKAQKLEVQHGVARLFGLSEIIKPDDASDAIAIAVCHARLASLHMQQVI